MANLKREARGVDDGDRTSLIEDRDAAAWAVSLLAAVDHLRDAINDADRRADDSLSRQLFTLLKLTVAIIDRENEPLAGERPAAGQE